MTYNIFENQFIELLIPIALAAKVIGKSFDSIIPKTKFIFLFKWLAFLVFFYLGKSAPIEIIGIAIVFRLGYLIERCFVASPNHPFLELLVLISYAIFFYVRQTCNQLDIVSYLQSVILTVWIHAAVQKSTNKQYNTGLFTYIYMSHRNRFHWTQRIFIPKKLVASIVTTNFGKLENKPYVTSIILTWIVIISEIVVPIIAVYFSGKLISFILMLLMALVTGGVAREWSFMRTNILFAFLFCKSFNVNTFLSALEHPILLSIFCWLCFWPIIHNIGYRRFNFSSSKLFGWGMYSNLEPIITPFDINATVLKKKYVSQREIPSDALIKGFAMTNILWLRKYSHIFYQKWSGINQNIVAYQVQKVRKKDNMYISDFTMIPVSNDNIRINQMNYTVYNNKSMCEYRALRKSWILGLS